MKKYISILLLLIFIIPSVAFASWWNPFSWNFFSFFHKNVKTIQVQSSEQNDSNNQIKELQKQIDELKNQQMNSTSPEKSTLTSDEIKAQVEKEVKAKLAQEALNSKNKTLSEQVGVSKDSLTTCIKSTDTNSLQAKIATSVSNAMSALPDDQKGTPYSIVIGTNGVKAEIKGALPYEQVKQVIDDVIAGNVTDKYEGNVAFSEPGDHLMGNTNASVKIIEYSDLECPYCKIFSETMKKVIVDYKGNVSWVYRHWPIHQNSFEKLVAAECVAKLKGNDAFWKYVDLLFGLVNTGQPSVADQL